MNGEKKKLNRFEVFSLGVGGAIGSGIFVMLGIGIAYTGKSISLAVLVGCLYMLLAYFFHIVMSSMFVLHGGDYDTKAMLMSPTLTGVSGIFTYMSGMTLSAYGLALVDYIGMVFPAIMPYRTAIAVLLMTCFFLLTIKGTKFVSRILGAMTVILLSSLALFVIVGIPQVQPGYFGEDYFLNGGAGFFASMAIMSFACQGTTMAPIAVMKETNNARRLVPSTILLICVTVGVVYALIGVVASGVLPIDVVANQNLALVAKEIFPNSIYVIFILGGAAFAIATSMLGATLMIRYPCERVAEDGWLPNVFKKKTSFDYPWVIMLLFYLIGVVPLIFGFSIEAIISLYMIPQMLFNVYLNFALIKLVKQYPKQWETSMLHMPTPIFNVLCIISSLCALSVSLTLFIGLTPANMVVCLLIIITCVSVSLIRLKSGAVTVEALHQKRQEIANRAIALTNENI